MFQEIMEVYHYSYFYYVYYYIKELGHSFLPRARSFVLYNIKNPHCSFRYLIIALPNCTVPATVVYSELESHKVAFLQVGSLNAIKASLVDKTQLQYLPTM